VLRAVIGAALFPTVIGLLAMAIGALVRGTAAGISAVMTLLFVLTPGSADALVRLLRLLDRPADRAVLAPLIEKEILWRLLTGEQDRIIRQTGLADSTLSQIGHAIRWIRDHHVITLRVEDLAALCAMSVSSFHRHFRAVTAMTPIQFQKHIHRVRHPLRQRSQFSRENYAHRICSRHLPKAFPRKREGCSRPLRPVGRVVAVVDRGHRAV
jgi:AraC-like DNA-binding protein